MAPRNATGRGHGELDRARYKSSSARPTEPSSRLAEANASLTSLGVDVIERLADGPLFAGVVTTVRALMKRPRHFGKARTTGSSENQPRGYSDSHVLSSDTEHDPGRDTDRNSEPCAKCWICSTVTAPGVFRQGVHLRFSVFRPDSRTNRRDHVDLSIPEPAPPRLYTSVIDTHGADR